ncbi:MAG: hypothetical protein DRP79_03380 [Planctomycetota bacterium]|nr:MAG: hypothetical protein DRP79_03380 [Planctomycetota bacterium]
MRNDKGISLSVRGIFKIVLCACVLLAVTAGAAIRTHTHPACLYGFRAGQHLAGRRLAGQRLAGRAAAADLPAVGDLRAKRAALRREEIEKRERDEARRWAAARQKGVLFVKTIKKSGELDKRIDVVIFADGFRKSELRKFSAGASRTALQLLRTYPYSDYRNYFNFHAVGVASRDSGVSAAGRPRDTAFGSRLLERNMLVADLRRLEDYSGLAPDMDLGIVLANTTMRKARSTAAGPYVTLRLGGRFGRTVAHELGHAFGNLADEYVEFKGADPNRSEPSRVNVTAESDPRKVKWHYWIEATKGAVNLYEGANLYEKGYYRPERQCLMRSGNKFCRVCLEQMIRRMHESVPPIDAACPMEYAVETAKDGSAGFAVRVNATKTSPVLVEWYVDGVLERRGSNAFTFDASRFREGEHEVMVRARCKNRNVLRDRGLLESSMFWKVRVLPYSVPVLDVTTEPLAAKAGKAFTYCVKGKSGDGEKALTYRATEAPDGLRIGEKTGEITWTPRRSQTGAHIVRIEASDGTRSVTADLVIAVGMTDAPRNRPPVIEYVPIQDVVEGELIEFRVKARDLDGHHVVYDLADAPDGATFDRRTGRFRWRPDFSQVGRYGLEFEAWDGLALDEYEVPVIVKDVLFGSSDMAAVEREVSRGDEDALFGVFYALRCKDADVKRRGITMLRNAGAKSAVIELNRLLRDKDESVAGAAAEAMLHIVNENFDKDDDKYFLLLLNEITVTCVQLEDYKARLAKLREILAAIARKSANRKVTAAAETLGDRLERLSS